MVQYRPVENFEGSKIYLASAARHDSLCVHDRSMHAKTLSALLGCLPMWKYFDFISPSQTKA